MNKLNIADYFSLYRVITSPLILISVLYGKKEFFIILLSLSLLTDMIDGFIARKLKITSKHGAYLDSIGDSLTFIVAIIGLIKFETDFIKKEIVLILLAITPYLIQLCLALWRYGKPSSFHTYLAKIAALIQGTFILSLLLFDPIYTFFYMALLATFLEALEEITLTFILPKWKTNVKGLYWVLKNYNTLTE